MAATTLMRRPTGGRRSLPICIWRPCARRTTGSALSATQGSRTMLSRTAPDRLFAGPL